MGEGRLLLSWRIYTAPPRGQSRNSTLQSYVLPESCTQLSMNSSQGHYLLWSSQALKNIWKHLKVWFWGLLPSGTQDLWGRCLRAILISCSQTALHTKVVRQPGHPPQYPLSCLCQYPALLDSFFSLLSGGGGGVGGNLDKLLPINDLWVSFFIQSHVKTPLANNSAIGTLPENSCLEGMWTANTKWSHSGRNHRGALSQHGRVPRIEKQ